MIGSNANRLTVAQRRRAMRLAYANAALWAIGDGLASTLLIIYLASHYGAGGLAISLIIAAPRLVGTLRLAAPWMIAWIGDRGRFSVGMYALGAAVLLALPPLTAPGVLPNRRLALAVLVGMWSLYHLLEYLGTASLWSLLGDVAPARIRGRFIGRRERWLLSGRIAGMLAAGSFAWLWNGRLAAPLGAEQQRWAGYQIPACIGAVLMLAAVIPLMRLPYVPLTRPPGRFSLAELFAPLASRPFRRLMWYGCWFGLFNGITQTTQRKYAIDVLGLSLLLSQAMRAGMRLGQIALSPTVGRWIDRSGHRGVMIASQLLVAAGLLFFVSATPEQWWWVIGAWVYWTAYVGLNVGLPNLMLKASPDADFSSAASVYFALTGLCFAASAIASGVLWDVISTMPSPPFAWVFVGGWLARSLGVVFLLLLIEPVVRRSK